MRARNAVFESALRYCVSRDADEPLLGGACTAAELLRMLAQHYPTACPMCGAEPWADIDCDLCMVCSTLTTDGVP